MRAIAKNSSRKAKKLKDLPKLPKFSKVTVWLRDLTMEIDNGVQISVSVSNSYVDEKRPGRLHISFSGIGVDHPITTDHHFANGLSILFPTPNDTRR